MDVSAFEADCDGITWQDLVPDHIREPLHHAARILAPLAGILLLIISIFGCSVAFVVMLVWIMQYWMLTRLLLATTSLLRTIYGEPVQKKHRPNENASDSSGKSDQDSSEGILAVTAAGLDAFESYLGTTGTTRGQHTSAVVGGSSNGLQHAAQRHESHLESQDREEAERRILLQEKELDAQIQAISTGNSGEQQDGRYHRSIAAQTTLTLQEHKDEKSAAKQDGCLKDLTGGNEATSSNDQRARPGRGLKEPCFYYQLGKCRSDADGVKCPFAHVHDPNFVAKPCHFFQMGYCQAGEECSYRHVKDPNFVRHTNQTSSRSINANNGDEAAMHSTSSQRKSDFTAEQMALAVSFAAGATRGRSSGKSTVMSTVKKQEIPKLHRKDGSGNALGHAKGPVRTLDPTRPTVWNLKPTDSPDTLPPHLKKLHAAKASRPSESASSTIQEKASVDPSNNVAVVTESKAIDSAYDQWQSGSTKVPPKRSGFEQILQTDDAASNQYMAEGSESDQQPDRLTSENAANGTLTIDSLKALDPRWTRQRRPRLPGSFLAGIEKGIRIIAGKEDGLRRTEREPDDLHKMYSEATPQQSTFPAISARKSPVRQHLAVYEEAQRNRESSGLQPTSFLGTGESASPREVDPNSRAASHDGAGSSAASSADDGVCDDWNADEVNQIDAVDTVRGQPQNLRDSDRPEENVNKISDSQPPIIADQTSRDQKSSQVPQEKTDLFTQMAELFHKGMQKSDKTIPAATIENQLLSAEPAPDTSKHRSGGYELDLVGLDFSVGATSPEKRSVVTRSKISTTPRLRASSREFAPNATGKEPEAKTSAAATVAYKEANRTMTIGAHPTRPERSGSIHPTASMPTVPLYVPHTDTYSGSVLPFHNNAMSVPSSHYYQPFNPPSHAEVTYLHQSEPYMRYPPAAYGTAPHPSPFDNSFARSSRCFPPTPPASVATRGVPVSKAVTIRKPPALKYNEDFPQLPVSRPSPPKAKIQPPPGLSATKSHQSTFDALLSQPSKVASTADSVAGKVLDIATSNPFDALLQTGNGVQQANETAGDTVIDPVGHGDTETDTTSKATQRKRKQVRADLAATWLARETIRKRLSSCWTLDGARALKEASSLYNSRRDRLGGLMASGQLREEDANMFPHLSPSDLRAPQASASSIRKLVPDEKVDVPSQVASNAAVAGVGRKENKPSQPSDDEIAELYKKAISARNVYADAHAFFTRSPPQGRKSIKDLKAEGEARIERAAKVYAARTQALTEAYGGKLPADVKEKLWTYDDEALKRSRKF